MSDKPKNGRKPTTDGRYQLVKELIQDKGLKPSEVGKMLGLSTGQVYQITHKLKKEGNQISRGMPDQLLRKMNRRAKQLLDGQTFGTIKEVKDSTVASLISEGWRRQYPVKQDLPSGNQFNFTTINLTEYRLDDTRYGIASPDPAVIELPTDSSSNDNS